MKAANDIVRFLLELAALTAYGVAAWEATDGAARWVAVVAAPLAAAAVWWWLVAPRAPHRLDDPMRLLVEAAVFGVAVVALAATDHGRVAAVLGAVAIVNVPLDRILA